MRFAGVGVSEGCRPTVGPPRRVRKGHRRRPPIQTRKSGSTGRARAEPPWGGRIAQRGVNRGPG
eukprot:15265129-Alexandrium_andersonii.AAC.1